MKKLTPKRKKYLAARVRYQAKRQTEKWKRRKKMRHAIFQQRKIKKGRQLKKLQTELKSPEDFSIINNTEEVLAYFNNVKAHFKRDENVTFDISEVKKLSSPTIALMVASIHEPNFVRDCVAKGNEPSDPELRRLFQRSGFYDFVQSSRIFKDEQDGILHKETHQKVVPRIAKYAVDFGTKYVLDKATPLDSLYEILIEMMSNTNNHADLHIKGSCYWWLYVYNNPERKVTSYTFLDLGVGIFKSAAVSNFLKNMARGTVFYPNTRIAEDLLAGKIKSRAEIDADIRGKGIPQIVDNAQESYFGEFYIISNDVKMNLKTMEITGLKNPLSGTLLYWELSNQ